METGNGIGGGVCGAFQVKRVGTGATWSFGGFWG